MAKQCAQRRRLWLHCFSDLLVTTWRYHYPIRVGLYAFGNGNICGNIAGMERNHHVDVLRHVGAQVAGDEAQAGTAAALAGSPSGVAWCHLNDESALLAKLIPGAVEISGTDTPDEKEAKLRGFSEGDIPFIVTKPTIGAWGLNWQHSQHMTYFPSHSYEQWYQAVRRMWRFGQRAEVVVDVISTEGGRNVLANLQRKAGQADDMFTALVQHMNHARDIDRATYDNPVEVPAWLES